MAQTAIFGPMLLMMILTLAVWIYMFARRIPFINNSNLPPEQFHPLEFAKLQLEAGAEPLDAALRAARDRFRPILMTAFSFILGVLPLLVASGAGAEARKVMGMTVFSGMLVATMLGVLLVPALYVVIEKYIARSRPAGQAALAGRQTAGDG